MSQYETYIQLLPHKDPFRFVQQVLEYEPGILLKTTFHPLVFQDLCAGAEHVPETCLIEGAAQSAIILTQLETSPLQANEVPMLGNISAGFDRLVSWEETVCFEINPCRLFAKQAILQVNVQGSIGGPIGGITISVAVKGCN